MAKPAKVGHNGVDPEKATSFVTRIENLQSEMESERGAYMNKCKEIRGDIAEIYIEVKDAGVSVKAMKVEIKDRMAARRAEKRRAGLEPDEQDALDLIKHALGELADLPLGAAAMAQAAKDKVTNSTVS